MFSLSHVETTKKMVERDNYLVLTVRKTEVECWKLLTNWIGTRPDDNHRISYWIQNDSNWPLVSLDDVPEAGLTDVARAFRSLNIQVFFSSLKIQRFPWKSVEYHAPFFNGKINWSVIMGQTRVVENKDNSEYFRNDSWINEWMNSLTCLNKEYIESISG